VGVQASKLLHEPLNDAKVVELVRELKVRRGQAEEGRVENAVGVLKFEVIVDQADHLMRSALVNLAFLNQLSQIIQLYVPFGIWVEFTHNLRLDLLPRLGMEG
jgi:hypothetical protein